MKKLTLLIISNLLVLTLFGQMFMEDLSHPFEPDDEAHYIPNTNEEFQLKQAGKQTLDSLIVESYSDYFDEWTTYSKSEYTYNEDENITLGQFFRLDANEQWMLSTQYEYAYDNDGNLTLYLLSGWDDDIQQLRPNFKIEYTLDNSGKRILRLFSVWDDINQQLAVYAQNEYTYDSNDNLTLFLTSRWDADTEQWMLSSKQEHTYNNDQQLTLRLFSQWSADTQQWTPDSQYDYNYDTEGDRILYLTSRWDASSQQWIFHSKSDYSYDSDRNLTVRLNSNWDTETQQWRPIVKYEYTYDNSYTSEDLIVHFTDEYTRHKLIGSTIQTWDLNTEEFANNQRGTYYFSEQTVGITSASAAGIEVFPNPTNDFITFNIENTNSTTVQLYDAQGKHLRTQALAQSNQLSVRHLNSGVYFYQLMYDGEMYGGKFIVK